MRYYYWYTTRLPVQAKLPNWVAATDEPKANFSQRLNYTTQNVSSTQHAYRCCFSGLTCIKEKRI